MSLYQCDECGCCENTALAHRGCDGFAEKWLDWTGLEDRRGKKLCSACAPAKYSDGKPNGLGKWHGKFARVFLPKGMFKTNGAGNLAHKISGDIDYLRYALPQPPEDKK